MSVSYYSNEAVFSAGGVLVNTKEKTVLLVFKETANEWLLPKGHIEENESIEQTAKREIYEETGYSNKIKNLLSVQVRPDIAELSKNKIIFWFFSTLSSDKKHENTQKENENFKGEWFVEEDALNKLKWDEDKKLISLAFKQLVLS